MSQTVEDMVADVRAGLRAKLGLRGKTLAAQIRKGGRLLPRHVRFDATYVAQASTVAGNPKLARMVDQAKLQRAYRNVMAHIASIDTAAARRDAALNFLASIAFIILTTAVLVITVIWWRGLI